MPVTSRGNCKVLSNPLVNGRFKYKKPKPVPRQTLRNLRQSSYLGLLFQPPVGEAKCVAALFNAAGWKPQLLALLLAHSFASPGHRVGLLRARGPAPAPAPAAGGGGDGAAPTPSLSPALPPAPPPRDPPAAPPRSRVGRDGPHGCGFGRRQRPPRPIPHRGAATACGVTLPAPLPFRPVPSRTAPHLRARCPARHSPRGSTRLVPARLSPARPRSGLKGRGGAMWGPVQPRRPRSRRAAPALPGSGALTPTHGA